MRVQSVAVMKAQNVPFRGGDFHDPSAIGLGIFARGSKQSSSCLQRSRGNLLEGGGMLHAKAHRQNFGSAMRMQSQHMMICAAGAQIHDPVLPVRYRETPLVPVEPLGKRRVGDSKLD